MVNERKQAAKRVFMEVAELSGREREAALAAACGDDAALGADVQELLQANAHADGFMSSPTNDAAESDPLPSTVVDAPSEQVGQMIGRYKLLEQIGEGGFGTVWAVEQRDPVKRRVALKIIKLGMDTKQVIARFEAERQALAMMDHPNIARVLDAGSTETGRPYFAMELVKGVPILQYCDTEKLDTNARLDLFTSVCNAIQHAHQKGIIHRDIKPSNVLITLHDGVPVPKVIDFGIAKATNAELTEKTIYTRHHQMIGTPTYMSPEQAEMSGLDIDTRADIYSLGVLLYELLTGTTPFDSKSLLEAGFAEMMRIIREETPHKPSTRLSTLGEIGTRTAQQRHVSDLGKLGMIMRGDLDWIVMKCLEKDRSHRYETANGLAADIRRHLNNEPVLASPPSTSYKLRKFVKRNRGQVIAGGVIAAALVLGFAGTSSGMVWALSEKDRADTEATNATVAAIAEKEAKLDAQANEQKAIAQTEIANRELARATEIKNLLTEMFESVSPEEARSADITLLKGILDDASARLSKGEIRDELVAAELHYVVGEVYASLGLFPQSERHLLAAFDTRTRVLGFEHKETLSSMGSVAILYQRQDRDAKAEPLLQRGHDIAKRVLGDEHKTTTWLMSNLAGLYQATGRYDKAEPLLIKSLKISKSVSGPEHQGTLAAMKNLALLYGNTGRYAEAETLYLAELEIWRRTEGADHPDAMGTMNNLASLYQRQGQYAKAEQLYIQTRSILERVLDPEHPLLLGLITNMGNLYLSRKRYEDAAGMYETSLPIKRRVLGPRHRWTRNAIEGLAYAYTALGREDDALPLHREWLAAAEDANTSAHTLNGAGWMLLTGPIEELRDPARALEFAQRACALSEESGGRNFWMYLDTLALAQHMTGDTASAIETQKRAIELAPEEQRKTLKPALAKFEAALNDEAEDMGSEDDRS